MTDKRKIEITPGAFQDDGSFRASITFELGEEVVFLKSVISFSTEARALDIAEQTLRSFGSTLPDFFLGMVKLSLGVGSDGQRAFEINTSEN